MPDLAGIALILFRIDLIPVGFAMLCSDTAMSSISLKLTLISKQQNDHFVRRLSA